MQGVHPDLVFILNEAIKSSPVDFTVVCGGRSQKEQQKLFSIGRTVKGQKVTYKDGVFNRSKHQIQKDGYYHAVDIYPFVDGKLLIYETTSVPNLLRIMNHIKGLADFYNINLSFGAFWRTFKDYPHIELL